jgi:peptidyl-prolyl cis-trans isomerase C
MVFARLMTGSWQTLAIAQTSLLAFMLAGPLYAESEAPSLDPTRVVAQQGAHQITVADVEAFVALIKQERGVAQNPDRTTLQGIAQMLLTNRILAREAEDLGLPDRPEVSRQMLAERERTLARMRMKEFMTSVPDADYATMAREDYLVNKEEYVKPEQVKVAHILVGFKGRSKEEARALAVDLRAQVLADPEKFASLAIENSNDISSRRKGGDLGWLYREQLEKPFADAAFALKEPGDISEVVETRYGYHIIRLDGRKPPAQIPFEEIEGKLLEKAKREYKLAKRQAYVDAIKESEDLRIDTEVIDALAARMNPPPEALEKGAKQ